MSSAIATIVSIIVVLSSFIAKADNVHYTVYEDSSAVYSATIHYNDDTMDIDAIPLNGVAALDNGAVIVHVTSYMQGYAKGTIIQCYDDESCASFRFIEKSPMP